MLSVQVMEVQNSEPIPGFGPRLPSINDQYRVYLHVSLSPFKKQGRSRALPEEPISARQTSPPQWSEYLSELAV